MHEKRFTFYPIFLVILESKLNFSYLKTFAPLISRLSKNFKLQNKNTGTSFCSFTYFAIAKLQKPA